MKKKRKINPPNEKNPTSTVESPQENKSRVSIINVKRYKQNTQTTNWSKISDQELTSIKKDLKPFWNNACKEMSSKLWSPTVIDSLELPLNYWNGYYHDATPNLWLNSTIIVPKMNRNPPTYSPLPISTRVEPVVEEDIIRIKGVKLKTNRSIESKFNQWIGTARFTYNQSNQIFQMNKLLWRGISYTPSLSDMRKFITPVDMVKKSNWNWMLEYPSTIREKGVERFIKSLWNNIKKCKKTKQPFQMHYQKKRLKESIEINARDITVDRKEKTIQFFKSPKFKLKMKYNGTIPKYYGAAYLVRSNESKFYLHFTYKVVERRTAKTEETIALDPGVVKFQTGYTSRGEAFKFGNGVIHRIKRIYEKVDPLYSKRSLLKKDGVRYKKLTKKIEKIKSRARNLVSSMHEQLIHFLLTNFKEVIIPPFNSHKMSGKYARNINNKTVRKMLTLRHGEFRRKLIEAAQKYTDSVVLVASEAYTSKTCSGCGSQKKVKGSGSYNCLSCNTIFDRDINASKNIFLRTYTRLISV